MHKSRTMFKLRDDIYETIMEFRLGDMGYGGGTTDEWIIRNAPTKEDVQAAVESAVYTALEWE